MGKPLGFLDYERFVGPDRCAVERVCDWQEIHRPLTEQQLQEQGARCMDCGIPFCSTGELFAGMASGCPLGNLIPEWNDLVYHGRWQEAAERLRQTNNLPEITGRVCPAPCEGSCTLGVVRPAVAIKELESAIAERAFQDDWRRPRPPKMRSGRSVAVVGSGPAGLSCADELNQMGHHVTIYERSDRIGGLLMYGIPNMKLDKETVNRRVRRMQAEGICFVTDTEIGVDVPAADLETRYDAVVLCCGATKPRDLQVPGRELAGIHFAVDFLTAATRSLLESELRDEGFVAAAGKRVVVIGGGDTGTDCTAVSVRLGCESITQLEIMPQLPAVRDEANPWPEWPRVHQVDYGHEEAAARSGRDPRLYSTMTKRFIGDEYVTGVETVRVEWVNQGGRRVPEEVPGSCAILPADLVLLAMGFVGPEDTLPEALGLTNDQLRQYSPGRHGLFIAGDMRRGQSLVVWAIAEGREVAAECHRFLSSLD